MSDASSRTSAPSRAARRRTIVEESWFGAFGATGDAPSLMDDLIKQGTVVRESRVTELAR